MANSGIITGATGAANLNASLSSQTTKTKKNDQLGKDEFLTLLITQLKNQDPESPTDSKEFATQLAQFTQVERLISIDDKLGTKAGDASSVAGYLGQQVTLDGSRIDVKGGQGGQLSMNLAQDATEVTLQLLDKDGEVVGEKALGAFGAGKQNAALNGLSVPDGTYGIKVSAISARGTGTFIPDVSLSGIVSGFIPGPDPKLIVDGREISISAVKQVSVPPKESSSTGQSPA
jgi:flagellar basal-body rod modification protein FlgD